MEDLSPTQKHVQKFYGQTLTSRKDLKCAACLGVDISFIPRHQEVVNQIHEEVLSKYYGCAIPIPQQLEGLTVLDLGSGSGRDVYLASQLVGEKGKVIGIDMTEEQMAVAKKYQEYNREKWGHAQSNVTFIQGKFDDMKSHHIEDNSIDVVISNCTVSLVDDKSVVLKEIFRVLKEGGELYFSDVYADRRVPLELVNDPKLFGESLTGAVYEKDFKILMRNAGFVDYRLTKRSTKLIKMDNLAPTNTNISFSSLTIRAFKISGLDEGLEDYGQTATYNGGMDGFENEFLFDTNYFFSKGEAVAVDRNTALMLKGSRFEKFFTVTEEGPHRGPISCCGLDCCAKKKEQ